MRTPRRFSLYHLLLSVALISLSQCPSRAQFTRLHDFIAAPTLPWTKLLEDPTHKFFLGTSEGGGAYGGGAVFKVDTSGHYTVLADFGINAITGTDYGTLPLFGLLAASDGNYYGITYESVIGYGTVYQVDSSTYDITTLYTFSGGSDQGQPDCALVERSTDGLLYGTTSGTTVGQYGTIFSIHKDGTGFTTLYAFKNTTDQLNPVGGLVEGKSDHALYGVTNGSSTSNKYGTVFKYDPSTNTFTTLATFTGSGATGTGANTQFALTQGKDGNFYGTTEAGGTNNAGTLFKVTPTGAFTLLYSFTGGASDGGKPFSSLTEGAAGTFYGMTATGGASGAGTAFKLVTGATPKVTIIHSFTPTEALYPVDALTPPSSATLYGVSLNGGPENVMLPGRAGGSFFKMTTGGTTKLLATFGATEFNGTIYGIRQAGDANFYGAAPYGGPTGGYISGGCGVVFKMDPNTGATTPIYSFTDAPDTNGHRQGFRPTAPPAIGADGLLYGTTSYGGDNLTGIAYKMDLAGTIKVLHQFVIGEGFDAWGSLCLAGDGNFYGANSSGGPTYEFGVEGGSVFQMTPAGAVKVLHTFGAGADGNVASGGLVEDSGGTLYGVCQWGGSSNHGVLYRVQNHSSVAIIHNFSGADGSTPYCTPAIGPDGSLYGTTRLGGANSAGCIWKFNRATLAYTKVFDFNSANSGPEQPGGRLLFGSDGMLYGTTALGGANGAGTIYQFNPTTASLNVLYSLNGTTDGFGSVSGFVLGSDANLYGTTVYGGAGNAGTIFRLNAGLSNAVNVTGSVQVSFSSPISLGSGTYSQDLTITNNGANNLIGPFQAVLIGLPKGVSIGNPKPSKVPAGYSDSGSPCATVPGGIFALAPGKAVTLKAKFHGNPGAAYTVHAWTGRF